MSTTDSIHDQDQGEAVVDDDGASILAGSQVGRAYAGHTDQRFNEQLEQATAELGRYCELDDLGRLGAPHLVKNGDIDFLTRHVAKWYGATQADGVELLVDEALISFQLDRRKRDLAVLGSVSLDLAPDGRYPQDIGHPTEPKVLFVAVDAHTAGTKPLYAKGKREYMAVWFVPNVDGDGTPLDRDGEPLQPRGKAGRLYCDDRWIPGYVGVVDWFGSRSEAKQALRELQQAVRTIAKPPVMADVDDPVRQEGLEADEAFDKAYADWARTQRQPENQEPADPFS